MYHRTHTNMISGGKRFRLDHASDAFHDRRCVPYEQQISRSDVMEGLQETFS
jgi:hypothetical protein